MYQLTALLIVVIIVIIVSFYHSIKGGKVELYSIYTPGDANRRAHIPIKRNLKPAI